MDQSEKIKSLENEGKTDSEILAELKLTARPLEVKVNRAAEVVEMLED